MADLLAKRGMDILRRSTKDLPLQLAKLEINICPTRRPNVIPLQSNPIIRDATPNGGVGGWVPLTVHLLGAMMPDVLKSGSFRWFEKTQGPAVSSGVQASCTTNHRQGYTNAP
ncbi:hypothetical protein TNCV_3785351 [Trichonephila clavipes]|nr:hypothetical protein TNCV_3785351 [Trichonephila clavipes]